MMSFRNFATATTVYCFLLAGCGGGSSSTDTTTDSESDSDSDESVLTGVFVDSPVEGVTFTTDTQSGVTNASGEFNYIDGEPVVFSIGSLEFPIVLGATQITPVDMAASASVPSDTTTNIARLLQSLDQDGIPENGIQIPSSAAASASSLNFDVNVDAFASDAAVVNLVANSGSVTTELISAEAANEHLDSVLGNTSEGEGDVAAFNLSDLIAGSPWYSIRVYDDRSECGNSYSFADDGSLSAASNGQTISGTYSLSNQGMLSLDTDAFGVESWQLASLSQAEWSSNKTNNDGDSFLERAFSDRATAVEFGNSAGSSCDSSFP